MTKGSWIDEKKLIGILLRLDQKQKKLTEGGIKV